jgi:LmbE family N-acetylglucosaminyl deacetylase
MNVLIVAAHPDDEVLMAGGTLARLAQEGHTIYLAILGVRHLQTEANAVAALLGASRPMVTQLPDQRFDSVDLLDMTKQIETVIVATAAEAIYTHHTADLNLDHALTARAVLTATRPKPGCPVKDVYMGEVPSCTEWGFNYQFKPNVFVDITTTLNTKLKAMTLYTSEMRPFPHPRSPDMLTANAHHWGAVAGCGTAEAFELVRSLR